MTGKIAKEKANIIFAMEQQLENELLKKKPEKLWSESFIKRQIDKRARGDTFALEDHIRAMVYSMLSGGQVWDRYAKEADINTGYITRVDSVFHDYKVEWLLSCSPEQLYQELQEIHLAPRYGSEPIEKLITVNIPKLRKFEDEYGTIDDYYQTYIQSGLDNKLVAPTKYLIENLSSSNSNDKMEQMGIPLVCEYLRNVGYDVPKPDTHIRRVLGSDVLGFSTSKELSEYKAIEIIYKIAKEAQRSVAETDYILWSYCATGYGEVCTTANPKCDVCVAYRECRKHMGDVVNTVKNQYVLSSHYGLRETDSVSDIIRKAADISYTAFRRRIFHDDSVSVEDRKRLKHEVEELLADRIPELLNVTGQKEFDDEHHIICEAIIHVYNQMCSQSYGIAQRWLNETLKNLVLIDSSLSVSKLPVMRTRKYFHAPVRTEVLQAAATERGKERFHCGLEIKCASLRHENPAVYEMDWFAPENTQKFEKWGYAEYVEFQNAIRGALKNPIKSGVYKDVFDWSLNALVELA